ncbi:ABC transporter substrate-binding protein [Vibrio plantisponsor]|uniref:ABC transporter substrate-binding protein n=1 Tax=Vibrio plantisponsor TaxID=664643 RepID=A0ABU4IQ25_9VIBR|nr:ABC transporter substrate-binding protein [Vibrio plantisponsor]MDW6019967.1 ABC transporter substrate-binding protein [Vibrio plantisponsor]NNM42103.1 carbohydrate ABC transporter substrate-binding protein [Vibrio plantisponsor]
MNQKVLTTLIAAAIGATSASAFADVELRMSWWGGNSRHQATLNAIQKFEEQNPGIKVKAEYTGWDGHLSRLTTQVAGNTEPDVMQTNWNWLPIFSKNGDGFYDMNKQKDILHVGSFPQNAIDMTTVEGKINGLPVSMTSRVFYYNTPIWQKAGVEFPTDWDQLMAAGKAFEKNLGADYYPLVIEARDVFAMNRSYMLQTTGKDIIDAQKTTLAYSQEEMEKFFQLYVDQVNNHVFPSTKEFSSYGKGNLYEMRPWIDGRFGGVYMWDTAIAKYTANLAPGLHMDLGPYPMAPGATDSGLLARPSMMFSIGRNSKHPEEAAKLVTFLLNDPIGVKALGLARGIPMSKEGLQTLHEAGEIDPESLSYQGYLQAQGLPKQVLPTTFTDNAQLMELFGESMEKLDYGQTDVKGAAQDFLRRGNRILKRIAN